MGLLNTMELKDMIPILLIILLISIYVYKYMKRESIKRNSIKRNSSDKVNGNNSIEKLFKKGDVMRVNDNTINPSFIPKVMYKTGIDEYEKVNYILITIFNKIIQDNDIDIEYYSDEGSRQFIENNFDKEVLWAYDKLIPGAYKADLFRYCILYKRGGIYSDLSQRFMVPLSEIIDFQNDNLVLVRDVNHRHLRGVKTGLDIPGIQINFMASRPRNKIYLDVINNIVYNCKVRYYGGNPLSPTGPSLFYKNLQEYKGEYKVNLRQRVYPNNSIVDQNNRVIILNKINNHNSIMLKGKPHYSVLWMQGRIYSI